MATEAQNFTMFAGETKVLTVTATNAATWAAIDLTAATILWKLKDRTLATILSFSVGAGITNATPTTGIFTITLSAANTSPLSGDYVHECRVTLGDGTVSTIFTGTATFKSTLI